MDLVELFKDPQGLAGKRAVIFGLGKSGAAAAVRLAELGLKITVTDSQSADQLKVFADLLKQTSGLPATAGRIELVLGGHPETLLKNADFIVLSPGVPAGLPILTEARGRRIPIIGELELASLFFPGVPFLAVTGTNGKTTTTDLLGRLVAGSGRKTAVAGNIGTPLMAVRDRDLAAVVVEVSSYQLETATFFKPKIALFLNLTPDHLGRHRDMAGYAEAKAKLWHKQGPDDLLVYNADDQSVVDLVRSARSKLVPFSVKQKVAGGVYCDGQDFISTLGPLDRHGEPPPDRHCEPRRGEAISDNEIASVASLPRDDDSASRKQTLFPVSLFNLIGLHNQANAAAAVAAALVFDVPLADIKKVLADYRAPEHRIELVRVKDGVVFVNDSKATNPDSVLVALEALPYPPEMLAKAGYPGNGTGKNTGIVLILGGRDKNTPLEELVAKIKVKVRQVVLLGEAADRLAAALEQGGYKSYRKADSFAAAVRQAYSLAAAGETVLLSPACASFDMFSGYEERGRVFKELVRQL